METLVTGATGFIGTRLVEKLRERGVEVRCIAKDPMHMRDLKSLGVELTLADLNNGVCWERMLDGVDRIYHLAGATRAKRTSDYYTENHLATRRFVEVCSRFSSSIERFVYVSSQTAAGPSIDGSPVTEEDLCHPVSEYGRSKLLAEEAVRAARSKLRITIVRPTAVYGPRDRDFLDYFKIILHGIQPLIGFREKFMSLVHVDDLIDGILLAGEHPHAVGETYFLGSEVGYSTGAIGAAIAAAVHRRPVHVRIPHAAVFAIGALAQFAGRLAGKRVFFNIQKVRESTQRAWTCSVVKAMSQLGYRQRWTLEEGMASTYRWYREHGWL